MKDDRVYLYLGMESRTMEEKKLSTDGFQWLYNRYIGDDPERVASFQDELVKADIASRIDQIRPKLRMSRADLAQFSGLTAEAIKDLEESDYNRDWNEAVEKINAAFGRWVEEVILPVARMTPNEYSIRDVSTTFGGS